MKKRISIQAAAAQTSLFVLAALTVMFLFSETSDTTTFVLVQAVGFLLAVVFCILWQVFKAKGWLPVIDELLKEED